VRVHGQVLIRQPPSVVFDFVADERNNYDPTIDHTALLTGEPIRMGTRFRCTSIRGRRTVDMIVEHRLRPAPPAAYHHPPRRDGHHQRPAVRPSRSEHPPAVGLRPPTPRAGAAAHPRDRRRWPPTDRRHLELPPDHPPTPSGFPPHPSNRQIHPPIRRQHGDHHPRGATRRPACTDLGCSPEVRTPAVRHPGGWEVVRRQTRRGR
jgi:hypothetical protein